VVTAPTLNSFKNRLDKVWSNHKYTSNINYPLPPKNVSVEDLTSEDITDQLTGPQA
jgi:hypothetical protein